MSDVITLEHLDALIDHFSKPYIKPYIFLFPSEIAFLREKYPDILGVLGGEIVEDKRI